MKLRWNLLAYWLVGVLLLCATASALPTLLELDEKVTEAQRLAALQTPESVEQAIALFREVDAGTMEVVTAVSAEPPSPERTQGLNLLSRYRMNCLTGLSNIYIGRGERETALSLLSELVEFVDKYDDPLSKGITYKSVGDFYRTYSQPEEAWVHYQKALEALPDEPQFEPFIRYARLGAYQALESLGRTEEALEQLNLVEAAAGQIEDIDEQQKALKYLHFNRGYFFLRHGLMEEAQQDLVALLELPYVQERPAERFRAALSLITLGRRAGNSEVSHRYLDIAEKALSEVDPELVTPTDRFMFLLSKGSLQVMEEKTAEGLKTLEEAERVHREAGFSGLSSAFFVRFTTYWSMGRGGELLAEAGRYLDTVEEPTDSDVSLISLYCLVLAEEGRPDEALAKLDELVSLLRSRGAKSPLMDALASMGDLYDKFEIGDRATEYYDEALALAREIGDEDVALTVQTNAFRVRLRQPLYLNDTKRLRRDFDALLAAYEKSGDTSGLSTLLSGYLRQLLDTGEFEEARSVLETMRATVGGYNSVVDNFILYGESQVARLERELSRGPDFVKRLSGRVKEGDPLARQLLRELLQWRQLMDEELAYPEELELFEKLSEEIRIPDEKVYNYNFRAQLALRQGRPEEALRLLKQAETLLWAVRDSSTKGAFRSALHVTARHTFQTMVRTYVDLEMYRDAFESAERGRGQALAAMFALGDERIVASATEEQKRLLDQLYARRDSLEEKFLQGELPEQESITQMALVVSQIDQVFADIAALHSEGPISRVTREVADWESLRAALEPDQVMLYYYVGDVDSFLFVLARDQELRVERLPDDKTLMQKVAALRLAVTGGRETTELSAELGRLLLKGVDLSRYREVVVVPDGPLYFLPFSILPSESGIPLRSLGLSVLPSAKLFTELQKRAAAEGKEMTVFADPIYSDPGSVGSTRSLVPLGDLSPLPGTAVEADILEELGEAQGFRVNRHTRGEASRDELFRSSDTGELRESRYLHFATHGHLAPQDARLSGLVLSVVNEKGEEVNAFLRLVDIYRLDLDADLVVLSACQTGLGTIREGEGLQGLYQGFMMAGSRAVLNTLWSIDDDGTAAFMRYFYDSLLSGKEPKEALSEAQQAMARSERWSAPVYWAGFQLVSR